MPKTAKQPTPRQIAARRNGSKGGLARAKNLSVQALKKIASSGGKTTHQKYGDEYFCFIASRRQRVGRYRTPVLVKA
jgi:hypothetical protein